MKLNVTETCRTCLCKSEDMYLLDSKSSNLAEVKIIDMLRYCVSSTVSLDNILPNKVCIPCFKTIRIAYNFVKQYHASQKKLTDYLLEEIKKSGNELSLSDPEDIVSAHKNEVDNIHDDDHLESEANTSDGNLKTTTSISNIEMNTLTNKIIDYYYSKRSIENEDHQNPNASVDNINPAPCPVCREDIKGTSNLLEHLVKAHKNIIFYCNNCKEKGKYIAEQYVQHLKEKHLSYCIPCDLPFPSQLTLACHEKTVHQPNDEGLSRDECPKSYKRKWQIVRHKTEKLKFSCEDCGKMYRTNDALRKHMKRHFYVNTNKEYKCEVCNRLFQFPFNLKRHIKVHSNVDNFLCMKCGKGFRTYDSYNYHKRTHDNTRKHMCSFCGLTFLQAVHLKYHIDRKHKMITYRCEICEKTYTSPSSLSKHKRKFHAVL